MSENEHITILNASTKIHFIAITAIAILAMLFYFFSYTGRIAVIQSTIEKWTNIIVPNIIAPNNTGTNSSNNTENIAFGEKNEIDDYSVNMKDILSPF